MSSERVPESLDNLQSALEGWAEFVQLHAEDPEETTIAMVQAVALGVFHEVHMLSMEDVRVIGFREELSSVTLSRAAMACLQPEVSGLTGKKEPGHGEIVNAMGQLESLLLWGHQEFCQTARQLLDRVRDLYPEDSESTD